MEGSFTMKNPSPSSFIRWFADITIADTVLKTILATEKTVPDGTLP